MRNKSSSQIKCLALLLAIVLAACNAAPAATPTSAPPTIEVAVETPTNLLPTATTDSTFLQSLTDNLYQTTVSADDFKDLSLSKEISCMKSGTYTLKLAGNSWTLYQQLPADCRGLDSKFFGSWEVSGNQITFKDEFPRQCPESFTYQVNLEDNNLRLTKVADNCPEREVFLGSHPWQKSSRTPPSDATFAVTVTKEDFMGASVGEKIICESAGTFTLTLSGSRWYFDQKAAPGCTVTYPWGSGSWQSSGINQWAFQDDYYNDGNCSSNYAYLWSYIDNALSFIKIADNCRQREIYLTSHPWVKQATTAAIPKSFQTLGLWVDATDATIGKTEEWTNWVETADLNGDGLVDIIFANGGGFIVPQSPEPSRIFLNQGPGKKFKEITESVFGADKGNVKVIKVADVNRDGHADIVVGGAYQNQSRLYLGDGAGGFTEVTATYLPQMKTDILDIEFGDVDNDGDLDMALTDWGSGDPAKDGGRTMLWLNDGQGHFKDVTTTAMPDILVIFAWDIKFIDTDNDYDLDMLVSCKGCGNSYLFINDGNGNFKDATAGNLPHAEPYDFEAMDLNRDGYLDLITINEEYKGGQIFLNNQHGGFTDATSELWPAGQNFGGDDAQAAFLDFDSDGDADFLIGNLAFGADRLMVNDGTGKFQFFLNVIDGSNTLGTLSIALADFNGDHKLDLVMAQGEQKAFEERLFLGQNIAPDTAPPVISLVEQPGAPVAGQPLLIRARVHDNKSPSMPHDWQSVLLRWSLGDKTTDVPMQWYGEYLWRAVIDQAPAGALSYQVCAADAAGNQACSDPLQVEVK